jgi:hypothetical protein
MGLLLLLALPRTRALAQAAAPRQGTIGVRATVMPLRLVQPDSLLVRRAALVVRDSSAVSRGDRPRVRLVAYTGS